MMISFLDTETTGLKDTDKVIGLGLIVVNEDEQEKDCKFVGFIEFYNVVDLKISPDAIVVHGIDDKLLGNISSGFTTRDYRKTVDHLLKTNKIICGHNVRFDLNKIKYTYMVEEFKGEIVDTMEMFKNCFNEKKRISLSKLIKYLNIDMDMIQNEFISDCKNVKMKGFHSCVFDAYCCAIAYTKMKGYTWNGSEI